MTPTLKKSLLSLILLALLVIGHDLTNHSIISAQFVPSIMAWSTDSRRLAVSIEAGALVIEEGRVISRCAVDGTVSALAFTPDGESLYVGTNEGGLMACNARTGRKPGLQQQTVLRPTRIAAFEFNPNDGRIFVMSGSQAPDGFYLYDASLTYLGEYNHMGFVIPAPAFLPDGRLVTFSREGDAITVYYEGQPGAQMTVAGPTQYVDLSPDGRYMLASTPDNVMQVFDVETGALLQSIADANYSFWVEGDSAVLSGMNGPKVVNLLTGEMVAEVSWEGYTQNDSAVLLTAPDTQPSLFRMDTGEMIPLNVGRKTYARIDFGLDDNLLLFGVTETSTDIITYPLSGTLVPSLHSLNQGLYERIRTVGGHAFGLFDNQILKVFDVNTGALLHEHTVPSLNYGTFLARPDGNAYAVREEETLTIRPLEGEETVITLPN